MCATIRKSFVYSQEVAQHLEEMTTKIEAERFANDGIEVIDTVALGKRIKL